MSDQPTPAPSSQHTVRFLAAGTIGAVFLLLSGLTLTGTMIALITVTPILLLCSPILVPAAAVTFLVTTGFFFSGGCGMAAMMTLVWMYNYLAGKHPPGADKLDYARGMIAEKARDMKERAKEYGQPMQQKPQEAAATQAP